jgi:hypothetical protein
MKGQEIMSKLQNAVFILCFIVFSDLTAAGISLDGTIKNGEGAVIAGATIFLASKASLIDTSNTKGEFTISNTEAMRGGVAFGTPEYGIHGIDMLNNQLRFYITSPATKGLVSIFSSDGKRSFVIPLGKMKPGAYKYQLPQFAAGFYVLSIALDQITSSWNLVNTSSAIFMSENSSRIKNASMISQKATVVSVDTLVVKKDGFTTVKNPIASYKQSGIAIVMERTKFGPITVKDLPIIKEMPDPLTMNNGTKVTTLEQWNIRRKEMIRILEDYEYGHMPPPPENVKASVATASSQITAGGVKADYRMMHLTFGPGEKLGFDLGIFTPVTGAKPYPVLISLVMSASKTSIGAASEALSRGYAVATINYSQLGADADNYSSTAFFPSYKEYDWRNFSAWAWGISRAVDYLVTDSAIDKEKIMATGVSRNGQAALLAGAFDERIALSAPVAGGMALRYSGKEMGGGKGQGITEIVDQNTIWFGPNFEKFKNNTPRLPCDQHWLLALTAPRLFIMCNSFADQYGRAYAAVQTYLAAKPVYAFLKADENVGLNFREGTHGMTSEDWSALMDFADQKLLKKAGTRKFDTIPSADKTP